ncbi:hypothetical protein [Glacieibacterium sp.]|uniref:hypothetical protein n=1 Tax=Glacieibacterium sp. TaxID=2860237 RepID=UPI003AFFCCAA
MATDDQILDGWLAAIERDGWVLARIDSAAVLAEVSPADVAAVYPDRWSALRGMQRRLDRAALGEAGADKDASIRDRLFGLMMARFDAAEDSKPAIRVVAEAARRDPGLVAFFMVTAPVSIARIAQAAGVDTGGWLGPLRVKALTILMVQVSRTWLDDEDPDLGATMKALDAALERAERWGARFQSGSVA